MIIKIKQIYTQSKFIPFVMLDNGLLACTFGEQISVCSNGFDV